MTHPLESIADDIWLVEGDIVSFYGFPYPTRSVIVRLREGGLWVWSPIRLTDDLVTELEGLGPVAHLVSPNKIHHLYLQDWRARYPMAALWGPQTTIDKRADLAFREALTDTPPNAWQAEIDQAWFRGSIAMDEIVFFHWASRTVILADLIENFSDEFLEEHWSWWQRPIASLDGVSARAPGAPREWRLSFTDRAPARAARDKVLAWDAERVVMAHGTWQPSGGQKFLTDALAWLGP
jgi:hypothetical protein